MVVLMKRKSTLKLQPTENEEQPKNNRFQQYVCAVIVTLGAFSFGNGLGWSSPGLKFLTFDNYSAPLILNDFQEGDLIASLMPFSAIFGAIPSGFVADMYGRRSSLVVCTIVEIIAWLGVTFANSVFIMCAARTIMGLGMGLYCGIIPMYIVEISEVSIRGFLGSLFELFVNLGILYSYLFGTSQSYFILCHGMTTIVVIFLFGLMFIPESPTYILMTGDEMEADRCLKKFRGPNFDTKEEINERLNQIAIVRKQKLSLKIIFRKENYKGLGISLCLMIFQQFSGIIALVSFGDFIFMESGGPSSTLSTIIVGLIQVIGTFVSGMIVDRVGRRILLNISGVMMVSCHATLGYYFWSTESIDPADLAIGYMPLIFLCIYIFGYSLGFGPIPWMMFGELLGPEVKSIGFGATVATDFICLFLVTFGFQPIMNMIGIGPMFWTFALFCVFAVFFVTLFVPETRNKTLTQIQNELAGRHTNQKALQSTSSEDGLVGVTLGQ